MLRQFDKATKTFSREMRLSTDYEARGTRPFLHSKNSSLTFAIVYLHLESPKPYSRMLIGECNDFENPPSTCIASGPPL